MNSFRQHSIRQIALVLVAVASLCVFAVEACAQRRDNRVFREAVTLDLNTQAIKTMQSARDLLEEQQWDQAIPIIQQLIDTHGDQLIAIETGRYWNVADMCHWLISTLPVEFLQPYRQRIDGQANAWLAKARESNDDRLLKQIVRHSFCSSAGDDALWLLGELTFERGEYAVARQAWERLVPAFLPMPKEGNAAAQKSRHLVYPDSSFPLAEVRARLVLCSIFDGQHERADLELASFGKLHPKDTGELFGEQGVLFILLQKQFEAASQWSGPQLVGDAFTQFAGSKERDQPVGKEHYVGDRVWEIKLPPTNLNIINQAVFDPGQLSYFPVVSDNKLFVCDAFRAYAFDLATGKPAWGEGADSEQPEVEKVPGINVSQRGEFYANSFHFPILPGQSAGVARYAMTVSDGRLYARMGAPFLRKSRNETNVISEIVGFDVSNSEGFMEFQVTAGVLDIDLDAPPKEDEIKATKWCFEGTPIVHDGRIYVTARRSTPEDEIACVCFDDSGQLIWRRRICVSLRNSPDHYNLIGHRILTWGNGQIFVNTGTGAIAALDAQDGKLNWIVTYRSNVEMNLARVNDPKQVALETCLYKNGVVFVAPADSNQLFALEASTGHLIWHKPDHDRVLDLLGVVNNQLITGGRNAVAFDVRTGEKNWQAGHEDADSWNYGRGWLTASHLYRPTRTTIEKIDVRNGALVRRFDLKEDAGRTQEWGGNLLVAGGLMIVAQPHRIVAFGEHVKDQNAQPKSDGVEDADAKKPKQIGATSIDKGPVDKPPSPQQPNQSQALHSITADQIDQKTNSFLPHRPWTAIAWVNKELRAELPVTTSNEFELARAWLLESLGRSSGLNSRPTTQNDKGNEVAISHSPNPIDRGIVKFIHPQRFWRGLGDEAVRFDPRASARDNHTWVGSGPCIHAADQCWFTISQTARKRGSLDKLTSSAPLRHRASVGRDPEKTVPELVKPFQMKSPWPVRRIWQRPLDSNDDSLKVHLIHHACELQNSQQATADSVIESAGFAAAPVILIENANGLTSIDPTDASERWTVQAAKTFSHFESCLGLIVMSNQNELQARDSRNGELVWRTRFERTPRFPVIREIDVKGDQLICVSYQNLSCYDGASGKLVWKFDPSRQRWSSTNSLTFQRPTIWRSDRSQGLFLPKGSIEYFRVDLRTGRLLQKAAVASMFPAGVDLLTAPSTKEWQLAGVSPHNRKVLWGVASTGQKWEHALAGIAHGGPSILQNKQHVIIVEDSIFGVAIDRKSGDTIWKSAIHSFPTENPLESTCLIGDRLVAISDRSVQSFDARDGKRQWKQNLVEADWTLTSHQNHVVAVNSQTDRSRILVLDCKDGSPVQSMSVPGSVAIRDIVVTAPAMFLRTSKSLQCFAALSN